jgi:hypothetical protein
MKQYTIENRAIYYGGKVAYFLDRRQDAEKVLECAKNVHIFLKENADISLLGDNSIFELLTFSCSAQDFPYIKDAIAELNSTLKVEPDDEDYYIIEDNPYLTPCYGDVLIKWDRKSHSHKCYDMGALDLKDLHDLLVFG